MTEEKEVEVKEEAPKGLSSRDALDVALAAIREPEKDDAPPPDKSDDEGSAKATEGNEASGSKAKSSLEAPAEWTKEEKEDFSQSSQKQQEASLRLHKSRESYRQQIRQEAAELQWAKDIAKQVEPFLKVKGRDKEASHTQILKAVGVVNEIDTDAKSAVINILKAKGIPVPKELLEASTSDSITDEKLNPLQKRIDALEAEKAQEKHAQFTATLNQAWSHFEQEKNAAGALRFPDVNDSGPGQQLASQIGSLVAGKTVLSQQFIANAKALIPGLTYPILLERAYRYFGGRVDDTEAPRSQNTQSHLAKSNRAAASKPGSGSSNGHPGVLNKKFKTRREALAAAVAELNDD